MNLSVYHSKPGDEDAYLATDYNLLRNREVTFPEIASALGKILEKVPNENDCFWISHAWAESLIAGGTISKDNFPKNAPMIRHDAAWKKDSPDYRGIHLSWGAEPSLITEWTRGKKKNLQPREYQNLIAMDNAEALKRYLNTLENGKLAMIIINIDFSQNGVSGHVVLAVKINGMIIIIDNSMEPGPWIRQFEEFVSGYPGHSFLGYSYPEQIY
ncbi:MAG: hypothetical protein UT55_C0057G0001 [Candidatus Peregrinibacteria bacterium GW2011_GWE2_39_6]|nr:MAG: hypothetical protein UT36_C0003G0019 [Candidatus Peregrinibacteria bacterium GW2011_GWF2_39_17]KKR24663.1 MAG: hypothetical protein UT55_C0057G0001 [Candidatus Peregrinibacteria bacterium GW2011_GWE2_39_6]HCW32018.1 hypothetical protein [Candidatus Peregrinibacteria bacterium]